MDKGAYELIKSLIQSVDQEVKLDFADGTSRTFSIDTEKLIAELDKDQNLEKEADWLIGRIADFCVEQECESCPVRSECRKATPFVESWREAARKAVGEAQ